LSTARVLSDFVASIWVGGVREAVIFERQSDTNKMRIMSRRSAGPLISKLRKRELARKRSSVSSMMSTEPASAANTIGA
jgi:hypothetical protein